MNRLNGWQRLGIVLSGVWCLVVIGVNANDYYKLYSHYSSRVESDAKKITCLDKARKGPSPEQSVKACQQGLTDTEFGIPMPERPSLPPALPILALLFLPIAIGWFVAYAVKWVTNWVREGFKKK
jgi:hypothetical protein